MLKTLGLNSQLGGGGGGEACPSLSSSFTHSANISFHPLGALPEAFPEDILSASDGGDLMKRKSFSNSGSPMILASSQKPDKAPIVLPGRGGRL